MNRQTILALTIDVGILMVLIGIVVYCTYKYLKSLPELLKSIKEYLKLKKELIEFLKEEE